MTDSVVNDVGIRGPYRFAIKVTNGRGAPQSLVQLEVRRYDGDAGKVVRGAPEKHPGDPRHDQASGYV